MRRTFFLIPAFLLSAAAAAQDGPILTEEAFLAVLNSEHPAALALTGDVGTAEANRRQAAVLSNPKFDFLREQPDDVPRETVLGVAWTPPIDGRRRWTIRESESAIEAERSGLRSELNGIRLGLRGTYAGWIDGHTRVAILDEHVGRLETLAQRMRLRANSGEESALDARRLEIAAENSKAALSEASARVVSARAMAAAWFLAGEGSVSSDPLKVRPELPALPEPPEGLDLALRPDLAAASFRVEQAEALERLGTRFVVAPEILVGWKTIDSSVGDFDGPVFGLSWAVPIFDRRQADRVEAESALVAARANRDWISQQAHSELVAAKGAYVELRGSALASQAALVDLGDVAQAATAAYEQGESGVTDLLDTLRSVLDARLAALDLYLAALEAQRNLEYATGRSLTSGGLS